MRVLTSNSENLRDATERSLTLLRVFLAASALILAIGAASTRRSRRSCSASFSATRTW